MVVVRIVVVVVVAQWSTWPWLSSSALDLVRGGLRSAAHPSVAAIQSWFHLSFFDSCFVSSTSSLLSFLLAFFFRSFISFIWPGLFMSPLPVMSPESDVDFDHRLPSGCHPSEWTAVSEDARPRFFEPVGCCASTCGLQALFYTPVLATIMLLTLVRTNC